MRVLRTPNKFIENAIAVEGTGMDLLEYRNSFPQGLFLELANMAGSAYGEYDMHFLIVCGERIVFYEKKQQKKLSADQEELRDVR